MHVESLPVLDDLVDEYVLFLGCLNPAGDFSEAGFFGGRVAALAGDDLVEIVGFKKAYGDGLENAVLIDRGDEFALRSSVQLLSRLRRVGADTVDLNGKRTAETTAAIEGTRTRQWVVVKRQLGGTCER